MSTHHCTCHECELRRQQLQDEAFADMVVMAHFHPEWFTFGDHDVPVDLLDIDDVGHDDMGDMDGDMGFDDPGDMGMWD